MWRAMRNLWSVACAAAAFATLQSRTAAWRYRMHSHVLPYQNGFRPGIALNLWVQPRVKHESRMSEYSLTRLADASGFHEHKSNGRGALDRTVNAATLEKLYSAAVAADEREVVLR